MPAFAASPNILIGGFLGFKEAGFADCCCAGLYVSGYLAFSAATILLHKASAVKGFMTYPSTPHIFASITLSRSFSAVTIMKIISFSSGSSRTVLSRESPSMPPMCQSDMMMPYSSLFSLLRAVPPSLSVSTLRNPICLSMCVITFRLAKKSWITMTFVFGDGL